MEELLHNLNLPSFLYPAFQWIAFFLFWVFVPGIMVGLVYAGSSIANKSGDKHMKMSARAGWWAGMILFVFFFIYQIPNFRIPSTFLDQSISLSWVAALVGIVVGFVALFSLRLLVESRAVGIITIVLSFSGMSSLYSYFFIRLHNDYIMSASLGVAFGALLYIVVFPKRVEEHLG